MQAYIADVTLSYVDWVGREACVVYFGGCDFRCPFCFVAPLLDFKEEHRKELREVKQTIGEILFSRPVIYFTGGEPCLQRPVLIELAAFAKKFRAKVGLQTNGSNPGVISQLITQGLIDYVSLDIKAPFDSGVFEKATHAMTFFKSAEESMRDIKRTLQILKENVSLEVNIRTTVTPRVMYTKEHVMRIAAEIKNINATWILQQFLPREGKTVNKNLASLNPPSEQFLEHLKESCLARYPTLNIEIKTSNFNFV